MYRLVVADGRRRRGIAYALVDAGEARLAAQGRRRITALVANVESDAMAFWQAVGYSHDRWIVRYVKTVADVPEIVHGTTGPHSRSLLGGAFDTVGMGEFPAGNQAERRPRASSGPRVSRIIAVVKRNLTVQLDEATVKKARVLAARRSTSVSKLVAHEIERLVGEDEAYQRAKSTALAQLNRGFHLGGGPLPERSSLHGR